MNQDQADKFIANWRKAVQELETFIREQPLKEKLKYRWATIDGERHVVRYYDDKRIYVAGEDFKYEITNFDSLGEFIR